MSPWDPAQPLTLSATRKLALSPPSRPSPGHACAAVTWSDPLSTRADPCSGRAGGLSRGKAGEVCAACGVPDSGQENGRSDTQHPDDFLYELLYGILA